MTEEVKEKKDLLRFFYIFFVCFGIQVSRFEFMGLRGVSLNEHWKL